MTGDLRRRSETKSKYNSVSGAIPQQQKKIIKNKIVLYTIIIKNEIIKFVLP